jgi:hypothetical protein
MTRVEAQGQGVFRRTPAGLRSAVRHDLKHFCRGVPNLTPLMTRERTMERCLGRRLLVIIGAAIMLGLLPNAARAACCYFSAKDQDVQQPGQKVFITWDPKKQEETFTVQPKFTGNARDFGMVIPTPSRPKLDEMPRDFFKELAVLTILKRREFPASRYTFGGFQGGFGGFGGGLGGIGGFGGLGGLGGIGGMSGMAPRQPTVKVVEAGLVGSLDYKILNAERADDLHAWLKKHKYRYKGDEATLDFYVKKNWVFTVMKIDTMQMKKKKDGNYTGQVTPTRFQFASDKLIYPLNITQLSVKDRTEALFYVQAPFKADLPGDLTFQFQWVPMLENARGWYKKGTFGTHQLPGQADDWLKTIKKQIPKLIERGEKLGFSFSNNQRPAPNKQGHQATTLEWAKRLTAADINLLRGQWLYSERVPNVDQGITENDVKFYPKIAQLIIEKRLAFCRKVRPGGFLVREAPLADVRQLRILAGHLQQGQFLTKFRKTFAKDEMNDDLLIVPAKVGQAEDQSEYEEVLPTSPP